jgi:hypothetical protein
MDASLISATVKTPWAEDYRVIFHNLTPQSIAGQPVGTDHLACRAMAVLTVMYVSVLSVYRSLLDDLDALVMCSARAIHNLEFRTID